MTQQNFLIGIGGTGARCVEAFLHLAAAGLGGERTWVGLIDQDESNGNVGRTKELLTHVTELRRQLRESSGNQLGESDFLATSLSKTAGSSVWCPLQGANQTLEDFFQHKLFDSQVKSLFDTLYRAEDQSLKLTVGFRGRPSIGAAIMMARATGGDDFWRDLASEVRSAVTAGREARMIVAGSIFGGTGAAGVPTVARLLRRLIVDPQIAHGVRVGGALALPYFTYPPPQESDRELAARADDFLRQTQGALRYYSRILAERRVFDRIYAAGWAPLIRVAQAGRGGPGQINPALLPELYAALAAAHFFAEPEIAAGRTTVHLTGRRPGQPISWEDLPAIGTDLTLIRCRLGQLARFAAAYRWVYRPALTTASWRHHQREGWCRRFVISQGVAIDSDPVQTTLRLLDSYCDRLLQWVAEVALTVESTEAQLFDVRSFAQRSGESGRQDAPVHIHSPAKREISSAYSKLVQGSAGSTLADVLERLTYGAPEIGETGLGAFLAGLYRHSALQAVDQTLDLAS